MNYRIEIKPVARRAIARLPLEVRQRVAKAIDGLGLDPRPPGCKRMKGQASFRIRIGDYRLVYDVEDNILRVLVRKVGHRKDIYDR